MNLSETPAPIRAFLDATNGADSEAFVAAFTPDATLDDWGRIYRGRDGIRDWDSTDNIGVQAHFDVLAIATEDAPDTFVATLRVSGNGHNGTGAMSFQLRDGHIASLRIS